jgi:hypothetical protein
MIFAVFLRRWPKVLPVFLAIFKSGQKLSVDNVASLGRAPRVRLESRSAGGGQELGVDCGAERLTIAGRRRRGRRIPQFLNVRSTRLPHLLLSG